MKLEWIIVSLLSLILLGGGRGIGPNEKTSSQEKAVRGAKKKASFDSSWIKVYSVQQKRIIMTQKTSKTEEEWKKQLSPEQFEITRKKGTEKAFTGEYWNTKDKGIYQCVCCGTDLFESSTKYDSRTGWPSFWAPIAQENIEAKPDHSLSMERTEVLCSKCGSHLGHLFEDGPEPTGLRYCMNSASLKLVKIK